MPRLERLRELVRPYYLRWLYFPLRPEARPAYFDLPWTYPTHPLAQAGTLAGTGAEPDFLFYPMTDWHSRIQRSQQLPRALAALGHRSFYVNPHLGRHFPKPLFQDPQHKVTLLEPHVVELHLRLPREPVFHHRLLTAGEAGVLAALLCPVLGKRRTVQIVSLPFWLDVAERVKQRTGSPIVYDCHDLLSGFGRIAPDVIAREADLFRLADFVVFSSAPLMAEKTAEFPELHGRSLLVRNGVDAGQFPFLAESREPARVAGYVGALDKWFDVDAVLAAAERLPHCRFVLAGRVDDARIESLRALPNVELPGEVPYKDVPGLLASFDCALIPFLRNPLTIATNPIKLYEYFSCGLPVASTSLPEVEAFGDLVYAADSPSGFADAVASGLAEQNLTRRAARRAVAERESWLSRAAALRDAVASAAGQ